MKKLPTAALTALVFLSASLFSAIPASAMPCDGPGCDGNSYTGYPGGKPPTVFGAPEAGNPLIHKPVQVKTSVTPPVVYINCYTGVKTQTTVKTLYMVAKDKYGKTYTKILDRKVSYLKRPVTKKECPRKLPYNLGN